MSLPPGACRVSTTCTSAWTREERSSNMTRDTAALRRSAKARRSGVPDAREFRTKPRFRSSVSFCAERGVSLECSLTFHFGQRFFDKTIIDHLVYRNLGFGFESFLQFLYFRLHCVIWHDAGV